MKPELRKSRNGDTDIYYLKFRDGAIAHTASLRDVACSTDKHRGISRVIISLDGESLPENIKHALNLLTEDTSSNFFSKKDNLILLTISGCSQELSGICDVNIDLDIKNEIIGIEIL